MISFLSAPSPLESSSALPFLFLDFESENVTLKQERQDLNESDYHRRPQPVDHVSMTTARAMAYGLVAGIIAFHAVDWTSTPTFNMTTVAAIRAQYAENPDQFAGSTLRSSPIFRHYVRPCCAEVLGTLLLVFASKLFRSDT